MSVDLRGSSSGYADAGALRELYQNRDLLIAVAAEAKATLGIADTLADFEVTKDSLKREFIAPTDEEGKPAKAAKAGKK